MSLGLGTKSARQSVLISKTGIPPKCWYFEDDCVPNGSTGKVSAGGGGGVLIYSWNMTFQAKCRYFFKEWSWSALKCESLYIIIGYYTCLLLIIHNWHNIQVHYIVVSQWALGCCHNIWIINNMISNNN